MPGVESSCWPFLSGNLGAWPPPTTAKRLVLSSISTWPTPPTASKSKEEEHSSPRNTSLLFIYQPTCNWSITTSTQANTCTHTQTHTQTHTHTWILAWHIMIKHSFLQITIHLREQGRSCHILEIVSMDQSGHRIGWVTAVNCFPLRVQEKVLTMF